MRSKNILLFMLIMIIVGCSTKKTSFVDAGITAIGWGETKKESLNNAFKNAVRQATSNEIFIKTVIENYRQVENKVINLSEGYIAKYEVLSIQTTKNGLVSTKIRAIVNLQKISNDFSVIRGKKGIAGDQLSAEVLSRRTAVINALKLVDEFFVNYPIDFLILNKIEKIDTKDDNIDLDSVQITMEVSFSINEKYEIFHSLIPYFKMPDNKGGTKLTTMCNDANSRSVTKTTKYWYRSEIECSLLRNFTQGKFYTIDQTEQCFSDHLGWPGFESECKRNRLGSFGFKGNYSILNPFNWFSDPPYDSVQVDKSLIKTLEKYTYDRLRLGRIIIFHNKNGKETFRKIIKLPKVFFYRNRSYLNIKNGIYKEKIDLTVPLKVLEDFKSISFRYLKR